MLSACVCVYLCLSVCDTLSVYLFTCLRVVCLWVAWVRVCSMLMRTSVCGCPGPRSLSWFVNLGPCPRLHHSAAGSSREGAEPPTARAPLGGGGAGLQVAAVIRRPAVWTESLVPGAAPGHCSWPDTGCRGEGEARPAFWEAGSFGLRGPVAGRLLRGAASRSARLCQPWGPLVAVGTEDPTRWGSRGEPGIRRGPRSGRPCVFLWHD